MKSKRNSRFQRGSAVYTCRFCGKKTRETGESESYSELCVDCFLREGLKNQHSDESHEGDFENCSRCR